MRQHVSLFCRASSVAQDSLLPKLNAKLSPPGLTVLPASGCTCLVKRHISPRKPCVCMSLAYAERPPSHVSRCEAFERPESVL